MSEDKNPKEEIKDIGDVPQSPITVHAQYLKDLSFENPNAPNSLLPSKQAPEVDINISVDSVRLKNENIAHLYEVILTIEATATREGKTLFISELKYGASVSIEHVEESRHHPILFVEVPRTLFPFARMILSNATQQGGFSPLQLAMVDFRAMYFKRFGDNVNKNKD